MVDFGDDLLLVRPRWLLQRFFGWLPLYDVEEGLRTAGAPGKRLRKIKSCLEHVSERYTRETLAVQAERHGLRMFDENDLAAATDPSSGGRRVCDLTLDDGPRWALLEVTTTRLSRHSATSGSAIRLDEDLLKLMAKVDQLRAPPRTRGGPDRGSARPEAVALLPGSGHDRGFPGQSRHVDHAP
ncbi:hypothetical protein GCM10009836_45570 [Pseudonocardia ailaonensis]|uniref:Uncharacterized protein n=1 Tax=Pseudonocardia ailaonensis TaxID=367279 RepID=A0ABN2NBI4_9PSEU